MSVMLRVIRKALCLIGHHTPRRGKVVWDGQRHKGHCRHCGAPLHRVARRVWRRV